MKKLIQNRSIAIVGRAGYLAEKEQGDFIDSHDVVVHMHGNRPAPYRNFQIEFDSDTDSFIPRRFQPYLGTKLTAYAPADLCHMTVGDVEKIFPRLSEVGCKYAILHKFYHVIDGNCIATMDYIAGKYMPVHVASVQNFISLSRQMEYAFPLPGTLLIYEILKMKPKNMYITGFSCYQDLEKQEDKAAVSAIRPHKPLLDLRFFRDLVDQHDWLSADSEMNHFFETAI